MTIMTKGMLGENYNQQYANKLENPNEIDFQKNDGENQWHQVWFFEKINKTDKSLGTPTKAKREGTQSTKL